MLRDQGPLQTDGNLTGVVIVGIAWNLAQLAIAEDLHRNSGSLRSVYFSDRMTSEISLTLSRNRMSVPRGLDVSAVSVG